MGRTRIGTQLLVDPEVKTRLEALAIVRGEPQAEVARQLIETALPGLERAHLDDLRELTEVAEVMTRGNLGVLTGRMVRDKLSLADVRGRRRYPGATEPALDAAARRRQDLDGATA